MSNTPEPQGNLARRDLLRTATLAAAGGLLFERIANAEEAPTGVKRQAVRAEGAPAADIGYSSALIAEGKKVLVISGQGHTDHTADIETQIRQTMDKIGQLLKAA